MSASATLQDSSQGKAPQGPPVGTLPCARATLSIAVKQYVVAHYSGTALRRLLHDLHGQARQAMTEQDAGRWYPEGVFAEVMRAAYHRFADSQPDQFQALVYDITLFTMRQQFREAMNIASGSKALEMLPNLWRRLHSGPAAVTIVREPRAARVSLTNISLCQEPLFGIAAMAMLRALLYATTGEHFPLAVTQYTARSIEVRVVGLKS